MRPIFLHGKATWAAQPVAVSTKKLELVAPGLSDLLAEVSRGYLKADDVKSLVNTSGNDVQIGVELTPFSGSWDNPNLVLSCVCGQGLAERTLKLYGRYFNSGQADRATVAFTTFIYEGRHKDVLFIQKCDATQEGLDIALEAIKSIKETPKPQAAAVPGCLMA